MKYALLLFIFSFTQAASARTITSFKNSDAITTVTQFMSDVRDDLPQSVLMTDKKMALKDSSNCINVSAAAVIDEVLKGIKKVLRFYPDEELPIEQALIDLEDYLDNKSYKKCQFERTTNDHLMKTTYFFDAANKIYLRMDNRTLLVEGQ